MPPSTCCFCTHLNPARAKFCNECASPLHLKPCRQCDAVNAREAATCYRCAALLAPAPAGPETSAERIVAEADETLAALKRELVAPAAPRVDVVVTASDVAAAMHEREDEGDAIDDAEGLVEEPTGGSTTRGAAHSDSPRRSEEAGVREPPLQAGFPSDGAPASRGDLRTVPAEAPAPPTSEVPSPMTVDPDDRRWHPEPRSRAPVVLALVALLAVPAAVYWYYNPAQVDAWLGRIFAPAGVESTNTGTVPAVPAAEAPMAAPAATTAEDSAPLAVPDGATVVAPVAQDGAVAPVTPAASEANAATPGPGPNEPVPASAGVPAAVPAVPERAAKASSPRAKGSSASGRSRERTTKPRPKAPPTRSPRPTGPPADAER